MKKTDIRLVSEYAYVVVGTAITGFGIALFDTPAGIAAGGVNGIGTILYHLLGIDTGVTMFAIGVPLVLIGTAVFGRAYGFKSILGAVLTSAFTTLFGQLTHYRGFFPRGDKLDVLLAAIAGGAVIGCGIGLTMRSGANTGGTDIVAQVLNKITPMPMALCSFIPDGIVIILGFMVFGLERGMFAIIQLYISSRMVGFVAVTMGTKTAKAVYIFSSRYEEIARCILREIRHGGTLFKGRGIISGKERTLLLAVAKNQQINRMIFIVHREDPKAFVFVTEAYQVLGEGFASLQDAVAAIKSQDGTLERLDPAGGGNAGKQG